MKVTKWGKKPWEGKKVTCKACNTEFELDKHDSVYTWMTMFFVEIYFATCPLCKKDIKV